MHTYVDMYNNLPTLDEADDRFIQRDVIFAKLAPLLARYDNKFGACLVHSHCKLKQGEKMIATGNISQPEDADIPHYPERWLDSGEPYEFTTEVVPPLPPDLIAEFQRVVGDGGVLGLYFAGKSTGLKLERTEGRKNTTEVVSGLHPGSVETAWLPGTKDPIQMACVIGCDALTTRGKSYHKGTRSHV